MFVSVCGSFEAPSNLFLRLFEGAWEWEHLQVALDEKLKNSLAVAQLMERIQYLVGRDRVSLCKADIVRVLLHIFGSLLCSPACRA